MSKSTIKRKKGKDEISSSYMFVECEKEHYVSQT